MGSEGDTISELTNSARESLRALLDAVGQNSPALLSTSKDNIQQSIDRLEQWMGNSGAWRPPLHPMSLDVRLEDGAVLRDSIKASLSALKKTTNIALEIASGVRPNLQQQYDQDLSPDDGEDSDPSSDESADFEFDAAFAPQNHSSDATARSDFDELLLDIQSRLDALFRFLMFLRQYVEQSDRQRALKSKVFSSVHDYLHITALYPTIEVKSPGLAHRLGEANARRRQFFKYRRDHHHKVTAPKATQPTVAEVHAISETKASKTVPATIVVPSTDAETEATKFNFPVDIPVPDKEARFLPPPSLVSFATKVIDSGEHEDTYPEVPMEARSGRPFLCMLCHTAQELHREHPEKYWKAHVLQDLEPYVCTFGSCELKTFSSERAWFDHELSFHRCRWTCRMCHTDQFEAASQYQAHLANVHKDNITTAQTRVLVEQSRVPVDSIPIDQCPFCTGDWAEFSEQRSDDDIVKAVTPVAFRSHVAAHLRRIALFALPRRSQHLGEDDATKEAHLSQGSVVHSVGHKWVREDCGRGWSIVSQSRYVFIAFSTFLGLYQQQKKYNTTEEVISIPTRKIDSGFATEIERIRRVRDALEVLSQVSQWQVNKSDAVIQSCYLLISRLEQIRRLIPTLDNTQVQQKQDLVSILNIISPTFQSLESRLEGVSATSVAMGLTDPVRAWNKITRHCKQSTNLELDQLFTTFLQFGDVILETHDTNIVDQIRKNIRDLTLDFADRRSKTSPWVRPYDSTLALSDHGLDDDEERSWIPVKREDEDEADNVSTTATVGDGYAYLD